MKADLPMHPSSNRQVYISYNSFYILQVLAMRNNNFKAKNMFYSPVLQTEGNLLRLDDERQFRHGKLYAAYVTV